MSTSSAKSERVYENTIAEEATAIGERAKGALKEKVGSLIGDKEMEHDGRKENQEGRLRQEKNDVLPKKDNSCNTR